MTCRISRASQSNPSQLQADAAANALLTELERVPGSRPAAEGLAQVRRERDELQSVLQSQEVRA